MIYDTRLSAIDKLKKLKMFILRVAHFSFFSLPLSFILATCALCNLGKHEEKQDEHGFVSRQFTRKYNLPPNYKQDSVTSTLSSDGILTISVVAPEALPPSNQERNVTITPVGPSRTENQPVTQDQQQQTKIEQVN